MKKDSWRSEWHPVSGDAAIQLTTVTSSPGVLFSYDTGYLPTQLKGLPGLCSAYISGSITLPMSPEGVTVAGELVAICSGEQINKGYSWLFGVTGNGVFINGPYKRFAGHHFPAGEPVPIQSIFGNVPLPEENDSEP